MNAKSILFAAVVALGTISFPDSADARPRSRHHYRSYPQYYHHHNHYYAPRYHSRGYYYSQPYYYNRGYYYNPYRYRRGTQFYLQYGPLSIHGIR